MTRTVLLSLASIGISPVVILALGNLTVNLISALFRPVSFSFRLYRSERPNEYLDILPALQLSTSTALLILIGSALILFGIARIQPEVTRNRPLPRNAPEIRRPAERERDVQPLRGVRIIEKLGALIGCHRVALC